MELLFLTSSLVVQIIVGLLVWKFLPSYINEKAKNLASKEDIGDITREVELVKNEVKKKYDLSVVERDFYEGVIKEVQAFLAKLKRFEDKNGGENFATADIILNDTELNECFKNFADATSELLSNAFVFLDDDRYSRLQKAFKMSGSFADIRYGLLDAMRESIHGVTELNARDHTIDIKYLS